MKTLVIASLVTLFAGTAMAGDTAVSASTLKGMGLGKMQQMSDSDGRAVRGKGPFDSNFFWNRTTFGADGGPSGSAGFQGPSLNNHFGDRFGWQGTGGSMGDPTPGGTTPGGTTPGGTTPGGTSLGTIPGLGGISFGGFSF
jgi:hypothetical protein